MALLSPKIRNERELTLTAMQAEQIWMLGVSMDFGYCKALTKVMDCVVDHKNTSSLMVIQLCESDQ